jgi:hypothetical protein
MAHWAVIIPADRYATERLFHHETVAVPGLAAGYPGVPADGPGPAEDDEVLVVAGGKSPAVVALGRLRRSRTEASGSDSDGPDSDGPDSDGPDSGGDGLVVAYTRRCFDQPVPADQLAQGGALTRVAEDVFGRFVARLGEPPARRTWLVSLDLPIEAERPAEAVRQFWSYVQELGPRELPTFVSPYGDELAMQAFVLGEEANQDPEEEDD